MYAVELKDRDTVGPHLGWLSTGLAVVDSTTEELEADPNVLGYFPVRECAQDDFGAFECVGAHVTTWVTTL